MSYAISELAQQGYGVQATCQAFELPRASYYRLQQDMCQESQDMCQESKAKTARCARRCGKWL